MAKPKKQKWVKNKTIGVSGLDKNGNRITLLNPSEQGYKYSKELKHKVRFTNDMTAIKQNGLSDTEAAYRAGYLASQKANARAYKAKNNRA